MFYKVIESWKMLEVGNHIVPGGNIIRKKTIRISVSPTFYITKNSWQKQSAVRGKFVMRQFSFLL